MAERSILELLLKSRKEGDAAKKTQGELKDLSKASGEAGKAAEKLNLGMLAAKGAVMGAGLAFLKSIPAIMDQGAAIERSMVALEGYTGGAEEAAEALEAVKKGARGGVDDFTAAGLASRLFAMGLATTAQEAGRLTEIAITLGASMGKEATVAFEDFSLMLANQSIPRLDTFGISAGKVRVRMGELQAEFPDMTRETRFMTAAMEDAEIKMAALDEAGFSAVSSIDKLKTTISNIKDGVIVWISDGLEPWIDGIYNVIEAQKELDERLLDSGTYVEAHSDSVVEWFMNTITASREGRLQVKQDLYNLDSAFESTAAAIAGFGTGDLEAQLGGVGSAAGTAADEIANVGVSLGKLTEAELGRKGLQLLTEAYEEGHISQEDYEDGLYRIGENFLGLSSSQVAASIALGKMGTSFQAGELSVQGMINKLYALEVQAGRTSAALGGTTTWQPPEVRSEGYEGAFQHGGEFIVGGPPGPDRTPVSFMATRGETVTVTPEGDEKKGGGLTIQGDVIIQSELTAKAFGKVFEEFAGT